MQHAIVLGAWLGAACGIAGCLLGTYWAVMKTEGPRERLFLRRAAIAAWIGAALITLLIVVLNNPYSNLLWIAYAITLPLGVSIAGREQVRLREVDRAARA